MTLLQRKRSLVYSFILSPLSSPNNGAISYGAFCASVSLAAQGVRLLPEFADPKKPTRKEGLAAASCAMYHFTVWLSSRPSEREHPARAIITHNAMRSLFMTASFSIVIGSVALTLDPIAITCSDGWFDCFVTANHQKEFGVFGHSSGTVHLPGRIWNPIFTAARHQRRC